MTPQTPLLLVKHVFAGLRLLSTKQRKDALQLGFSTTNYTSRVGVEFSGLVTLPGNMVWGGVVTFTRESGGTQAESVQVVLQ